MLRRDSTSSSLRSTWRAECKKSVSPPPSPLALLAHRSLLLGRSSPQRPIQLRQHIVTSCGHRFEPCITRLAHTSSVRLLTPCVAHCHCVWHGRSIRADEGAARNVRPKEIPEAEERTVHRLSRQVLPSRTSLNPAHRIDPQERKKSFH